MVSEFSTTRVRRLLRILTLVLILWGMMSAVTPCLAAGSLPWAGVNRQPLVIAWALCLAYGLANAAAWTLIVRALGHPLPLAHGIRIWIRCEAFRWLPGSVWNFGARSWEAANHGVPMLTTVSSIAMDLSLSIASRLLILSIAATVYASELSSVIAGWRWQTVLGIAGMLVGIGIIGLPLLKRHFGSRLSKGRWREWYQALGSVRMRPSLLASFVSSYVTMRVLHGVGLWCVLVGIVPAVQLPLGLVVTVNVMAWLVGFFAFFAPGGLVVREAALATMLAAWMSPAEALTVAVTWRLLQIAGEATLFSIACFCPGVMNHGSARA